ncbi:hypothetical protein QYR01_01305 [Brucella anthropi]|uniref:hypothetical protein n=1 Tax=Brucella anthropi TaxID=529 RepID=UPI0026714D07|nr:hypothetical protein [Brucella anthropi]WKT92403.1 hypothetical protein QYR01_01305 [Brucella anthropi]
MTLYNNLNGNYYTREEIILLRKLIRDATHVVPESMSADRPTELALQVIRIHNNLSATKSHSPIGQRRIATAIFNQLTQQNLYTHLKPSAGPALAGSTTNRLTEEEE